VLRHRRGSSSEARRAKARYLEGAKAGMPKRTPGGAALGSPNGPTGCGSVGVSSLDFFAADSCGGPDICKVAKNSNAPRAPTDPSASLEKIGFRKECEVLARDVHMNHVAFIPTRKPVGVGDPKQRLPRAQRLPSAACVAVWGKYVACDRSNESFWP